MPDLLVTESVSYAQISSGGDASLCCGRRAGLAVDVEEWHRQGQVAYRERAESLGAGVTLGEAEIPRLAAQIAVVGLQPQGKQRKLEADKALPGRVVDFQVRAGAEDIVHRGTGDTGAHIESVLGGLRGARNTG